MSSTFLATHHSLASPDNQHAAYFTSCLSVHPASCSNSSTSTSQFSDSIGSNFPSNTGIWSHSNLLNEQPCSSLQGASPLRSVIAVTNCFAIVSNICATSNVA
ncbi:hypothetical protein SLA2020_366790 [Shorea laevis]